MLIEIKRLSGRKSLFQCHCGKQKAIRRSDVKSGRSTSCGCLQASAGYLRACNPREYKTWTAMKQRCSNPNKPDYARYGGRGITFDPRWELFANFLRDMGPRPEGMSLDRIDNEKGYSASNCRWATRKEQQNNTRSNRWLTHDGQTLTTAQWSQKLSIPSTTLHNRLRLGWSVEKCLTTSVRLNIID